MDVRRAYCSAVDRNVPVVLRKGVPVRKRLKTSHPAALRCLDYPTRCTGWCCPLDAAEEAHAAWAEASPSPPTALGDPDPAERLFPPTG
ncbi:MAG: hypothetical protein WEB88_05190 [Gemmatimonadota bacterium]